MDRMESPYPSVRATTSVKRLECQGGELPRIKSVGEASVVSVLRLPRKEELPEVSYSPPAGFFHG
jgi:hypothetical protein